MKTNIKNYAKTNIKSPQCIFDCDMSTGLDASLERKEIRAIYHESLSIYSSKGSLYVNISDFKNEQGQSIGEYLLEQEEEFIFALLNKVNREIIHEWIKNLGSNEAFRSKSIKERLGGAMGTEYILYKDKDKDIEFIIDEMSNKLSLYVVSTNSIDGYSVLTDDLDPQDMAKIMLEGLTVCSYWMDTDELKTIIQKHIDEKIY